MNSSSVYLFDVIILSFYLGLINIRYCRSQHTYVCFLAIFFKGSWEGICLSQPSQVSLSSFPCSCVGNWTRPMLIWTVYRPGPWLHQCLRGQSATVLADPQNFWRRNSGCRIYSSCQGFRCQIQRKSPTCSRCCLASYPGQSWSWSYSAWLTQSIPTHIINHLRFLSVLTIIYLFLWPSIISVNRILLAVYLEYGFTVFVYF